MAKKKNPFMHGGEWVTNAQGSRFILRGRHRAAMALSKHILFDDEYDMQYACDYEPVADLFPYPCTSNEVVEAWAEARGKCPGCWLPYDSCECISQEIGIIKHRSGAPARVVVLAEDDDLPF